MEGKEGNGGTVDSGPTPRLALGVGAQSQSGWEPLGPPSGASQRPEAGGKAL